VKSANPSVGWPDKPDGDGFLPADVHIIGKDILWFHCVIWPWWGCTRRIQFYP
jgi:methionyl-tRNA synthetase